MIACYHGLIGNHRNWIPLSRILGGSDNILSHNIDYVKKAFEEIVGEERQNILRFNEPSRISIGNSLGCLIALGVADSVDRIILTAPPFFGRRGFIPRSVSGIDEYVRQLSFSQTFSENDREEMRVIGKRFFDVISDKQGISHLKNLRRSILAFDYWSRVKKYREKVHIVLGEDDLLSPAHEIADYIAGNIPEVSVSIIPKCGHAVPLEKPEKLAEIIDRYS